MPIKEYTKKVKALLEKGNATEHSYRGDLQVLIQALVKGISVTNEPKRQKCGAPDYILQRKEVPIGYIEAKDIGVDLTKTEKSEQLKRYLSSLDNLILTDYMDFRFFKNGDKVKEIQIASVENGKFQVYPENFDLFITHIEDFCNYKGQTIKSSEKLASMMAHKARMMEDVIHKAVLEDDDDNTLRDQLKAFRQILIHDLDEKTFADIYAQTIAYGLFAARLHDETLEDFSREEALFLIPKSNPFLRQLFTYIAGPELDERIVWIVNDLADIFQAVDLNDIMADFGKSTQQNDPFLHFYETFLGEYNPKLRKSRGVYYTPEPVVNFIVRAVDDILKNDFDISAGLADTSKIEINVEEEGHNKKVKREVHKVQILDPATGTGTFLSEVVKHIHSKFKGQQGIWSKYVEEHLIPRVNGFEILMASYTMCHLKIEMLLRETGYTPKVSAKQQRLRVFLTNSLEEAHEDPGSMFATWLSNEAKQASSIKNDTPVMVVLGNPPYSGESSNKGEWIMGLMNDYKKEPGGKEKLRERNPKWINDDYVKFLRFGQHFIEEKGEGVLAFINPHGFLDNPTFRGMRWNLLKTYDKIYTIDLHGNSKKKEVAPDGGKDENVFDIQQGVSINLFVKTGKKRSNQLGEVFHYDLYGKRDDKYKFLWDNNLSSIGFNKLELSKPQYFFVQKNFEAKKKYEKGISVNELFSVNSVGIVTARDGLVVNSSKEKLISNMKLFFDQDKEYLIRELNIRENSSFKINEVKQIAKFNLDNIKKIAYRPFDNQYIYYDSKYFIERNREKIMRHFFKDANLGLVFARQSTDANWSGIQIVNSMVDNRFHFSYKGIPQEAPLYLYPDNDGQQTLDGTSDRTPNLNEDIVKQISEKIGLEFVAEKEKTPKPDPQTPKGGLNVESENNISVEKKSPPLGDLGGLPTEDKTPPLGAGGSFAPIDILDYIYAVLHSPTYRETYKEFLKIDFPRVPFPKDAETFWKLVKLGGEIRQIHLLESSKVEEYITTYPNDGDNIITRKIGKSDFEIVEDTPLNLPKGETLNGESEDNISTEKKTPPSGAGGSGRVWINDEQYFDNIPVTAWEFYIGGYQPAQKWLKDRKGRELSFEDIIHYQKIIVALSETDRLMKEVDLVFEV